MQEARAFFYVCAGVFLLALSYHLGARGAQAQTSGLVECAAVDNVSAGGMVWLAVVDRRLYWQCTASSDCSAVSLYANAPIPGTARVVGCGMGYVVLEDGDVYRWDGPQGGSGTWNLTGHFPGGPTPAQAESWGAIKSRYRGERGGAQLTPQDR